MRNGGHSPFLTKIERSSGTPLFRQVYTNDPPRGRKVRRKSKP